MKNISFVSLMSLLLIGASIFAMEEQDVNRKRKYLENSKLEGASDGIQNKKFKTDEENKAEITCVKASEEEVSPPVDWNDLPCEVKTHVLSYVISIEAMCRAVEERNYKAIFALFKNFVVLGCLERTTREIVWDKKFFNLDALARYLVNLRLRNDPTGMGGKRFELRVTRIASRWLPELCYKLLEEGIFLYMHDMPLVNAMHLNKVDRVAELIELNRGCVSLMNDNAFTLAAIIGNVDMLKLFLKADPSIINPEFKSQVQPLGR